MSGNLACAIEDVFNSSTEPALSEGVTLVLPTKNEVGGIALLIKECRPFVDEIVVVDGHSTDGTFDAALQAGADKVVLDDKTGKGGAYKVGVSFAKYDNIVFMDADGSHDPSAIPLMVSGLKNHTLDVVVGSRIKGGSDELHGDFDNFLRAVGSGIITASINWRWNAGITDALNGFRAVKKSVFQRLEMRCNDFDIEQHMLCQALRKGFRVGEVPAHEYCRKWGKSKLPTFKKAHLFLWRLFRDLM